MIKKYWHTLKYLKPIQILYRLHNKFISSKFKEYNSVSYKPINLFIDGLHNDTEYLKRFEYKNGYVKILNEDVKLDYKDLKHYSPLIQYNIQYFEYGIVWAQKGIKFEEFKEKWKEYIDANLPLQPYVISLQIPNIIIAMNIYGVDDQEMYDNLYSRYKWLLKHQEKHLLANHYFENIKAIVIASYVFNDDNIFEKYIKLLEKECKEEILDDGVHFELSMMYHKLILEDLLLIKKIYSSKLIDEKIEKMTNAVISIEDGMNRTPLFNDAGDNVSKSKNAFLKVLGDKELIINNEFKDSGYYKLKKNNISLLIDAGLVGPNYNPGHAHCDCLSFEVFKDCKAVFVNSGTYQYQGSKRSVLRSTKSHNTIMIDNHEQSEVWGEHRVARRIKNVQGKLLNDSFEGSYNNYLGEKHTRYIELQDNYIKVLDEIKAKEGLEVKSFLHLSPEYNYDNNCIIGNGDKIIINNINSEMIISESEYSSEFGKIEKNICLIFKWKSDENKHGYEIKFL